MVAEEEYLLWRQVQEQIKCLDNSGGQRRRTQLLDCQLVGQQQINRLHHRSHYLSKTVTSLHHNHDYDEQQRQDLKYTATISAHVL